MALRKTALIRVPQLRRRRRRLCQSTCHGFPPAIRTRTVAWPGRDGAAPATTSKPGLTPPSVGHRTIKRQPRTGKRRRSHQQASTSHQGPSSLAPASVALAPRPVEPRTRKRRASHQRVSRLAPASGAIRTRTAAGRGLTSPRCQRRKSSGYWVRSPATSYRLPATRYRLPATLIHPVQHVSDDRPPRRCRSRVLAENPVLVQLVEGAVMPLQLNP